MPTEGQGLIFYIDQNNGDNVRFFHIAVCLLVATGTLANEEFAKRHAWLVRSTMTQDWDIFVATVQSTEGEDTTNTNPPVVSLQVEEVLRGDLPHGPLTTQWSAVSIFRCGRETRAEREQYRAWREQPLPGPAPGSRWLFGGYRGTSGVYRLHPSARHEYDPALVEWAREAIAEMATRSREEP